VASLRNRLEGSPGRAAAVVATQAIHGLGGIGKTRLAVEYAWQHQAEYTALLFAAADSPENLHRNLAALAGPRALDLEAHSVPEEEVRVAAVLRWLESHPGWLLILDNVDTDAAARAVESLLAGLQSGHVVITSRLSNWGPAVDPLELDVLDQEASAAFLLERTAGRRRTTPGDESDARTLASKLGGLGLALEQAGAYVGCQRCSLADYVQRWQDERRRVTEWFDERLMSYPRSLAVTWETTLAELTRPAQALLNVLAWLAPDPIPAAMLQTNDAQAALLPSPASAEGVAGELLPSPASGRGVGGDGGSPTEPVPTIPDALTNLGAYSMLKWEVPGELFTVHRLVQEITRQRTPEADRRCWIEHALRVVDAYARAEPNDVRTWPVWDRLQIHAAIVVAHADEAAISHPTARLMNQLGVLWKTKCLFREAEPLYRRGLAIDEQSFGPDHPDVATDLNNLALLLKATNRLAEAEPLMRRALAIDEQSFGPDYPRVAIDLNNLAQLLQETNRLAEAEPLMRRALAIDEQSFGPDHPDVARDLNNLAQLLQATNRLAEAEPLMRRALAIDEQSFGPDHPEVATDLNNLAQLLQATNRLAEAEPLMRRALAIDEQSFGPDHPDVARDLNNLAQLLQATNRLTEAEPLMRRALAIDEQSFGPDHPEVATDLNNLASLLQATNRLAEAEPLMRRVVEILEQSLGAEHPNVATALNNLALLLRATNRLAEAEPLMRRHVLIFRRFREATGHEHPHWRAALRNYSRLLEAMGLGEDEIRRRLGEVAGE
jgi:tetratricopeptide (TPR) repeat protein